jgi:hypothetical protein
MDSLAGCDEGLCGRYHAREALDNLQQALDALIDGKSIDSSWGELDDVSGFIMERHVIFKVSFANYRNYPTHPVFWQTMASNQ